MIDVRVTNQTILEEREIVGTPLELMTEAVTVAALILSRVSKDEVSYNVMRNALAETIKRLEYGNIAAEPASDSEQSARPMQGTPKSPSEEKDDWKRSTAEEGK